MSMFAMKHDNCTCTCTQPIQTQKHIIDGLRHNFMNDVNKGGEALNCATWKFIQLYSAMLRSPKSEMTFEDCNEMVKGSIIEYMERINI